MKDKFLKMLISAWLTLGVLLIAYGVSHDVVLSWAGGCIALGSGIQVLIDYAHRP